MAAGMFNSRFQIVLSFDTTASMRPVLMEVRRRLSDLLVILQTNLPSSFYTTAIVAHGDYVDQRSTYLTKHIDFTNDIPLLKNWVSKVDDTSGGDFPEAYEVMLRLVRQKLSWVPGSARVLVVIGDACPHPPNDPQNKDRIDWREETRLLKEMGVKIHGVQIGTHPQSTEFFKTISEMTGGMHMNLKKFDEVCKTVASIYHTSMGVEFIADRFQADLLTRARDTSLFGDHLLGLKNLTILMVGNTGNGKSSVGNTILKQPAFAVGAGMSTTTQQAECKSSDFEKKRVTVVDTPDILNLSLNDAQCQKEISNWRQMTQPEPDAILLAIKCDKKYTPGDFSIFEQFSRLWPNDLSKNLILAFTFGDNRAEDFRSDIQAAGEDFQRVLRTAKNRYVVFNDKASQEDKNATVRELFELINRMQSQR